ncbi:protein of unknown function [Desulfurella multipotens]|uniref:DUF4214 domain-containing protein n=1 Tax=Desulfurella multipotens TaxID=79269 RepID=A0A1G6QXF7_9BACT|nr:DUF4214 domain-containing protein [Desulfurella multipotens]SDC96346.1 protein of unknown function [Desulfurella multipotens]
MTFTDYFNQVQDLYIAYYQRPADPAGLIYWSQMAAAQGGLTPQIINAFANSLEAKANYGTITSANIAQVITSIYQALFNRAPDQQGLAFYENGFNNGTFTPGTIALNILNGARGNDAITLQNKLTAAMQFTQALDPALYTGSASQLTATYDAADIAAAKAYLSSVTADPSTLPTPNQTIGYIVNNIAQSGDTIIQTSTNYYEFTTGIDHLQGSGVVNIFEGSLSGNNSTIDQGDTVSAPATSMNILQIDGNNQSDFQLNQVGLTNIQNVKINNDSKGLDFSGTSGILNLTSNNPDGGVEYTLNGQNATINGAVKNSDIKLSGTIGNVVLANDSGKVTYSLTNTNTTASTQNLTINTIGKSVSNSGDTLKTSNIATLNLNVSGKNYVNSINDNSTTATLTTLNISGAANASLNSDSSSQFGTYISGANASALTTLNIAGAAEVYLDLSNPNLSGLATVNAANDTANLYLDFATGKGGAGVSPLASGFTFTGGTSPTTELTFSSNQLSNTHFGTIKPGSGNNILGINDGNTATTIDNPNSSLTKAINTSFSGFRTLDILTTSGSNISGNLLTSITTYNIDNTASNTISGLTSSNTVNILKSTAGTATDTLSASGTNQILHLNIGDSSNPGLTIGTLNTDTSSTSGFGNVVLNSSGSGTSKNIIKAWDYAGTSTAGSTTAHNVTIGGNYDLSIANGNASGLVGYFGSTGQTSALNITNVFNASQFSGASQTGSNVYHLSIVDSTQALGSTAAGGPATVVTNLFIAPTNTTMSLTDNTSGNANATVNVYFDVHNAQYGNLSGGLVDYFTTGNTHGNDYLLFDTNAVGGGASNTSYGSVSTVTTIPVTSGGPTLPVADLQYIDTNGKANTLYQFQYNSLNYIVDTGASTSTINDDIVVLIGSANAIGSVTTASVNDTTYHAVHIA